MPYDFNTVVSRQNSNSMKYDFHALYGFPEDAIPMWVADMDFPAPKEVGEAIKRVADHGIYGYTDYRDDYMEAVQGWYAKRHGYTPQPEWLQMTPGVVFAVTAALHAFTRPGDGVMVQRPVYYPFSRMIEWNGRKVINSPLAFDGQRYEIDFDAFERDLKEKAVRLFIFCNPHNPVGKVWSREDVIRVGELCLKHSVLVLSDEIHCDFAMFGKRHTIFPSISKEFEQNCIWCTAPSKTFNIAGLQISNIFLPNPQLKKQFTAAMAATGYMHPNICGLAAAHAAFRYGGDWYDAMIKHLEGNIRVLQQTLEQCMPKVRLIQPDGTFLMWLDFRNLGLSDDALSEMLRTKAHVWLDRGVIFGDEGSGFMRMNIACPRPVLEEALKRMAGAIQQ